MVALRGHGWGHAFPVGVLQGCLHPEDILTASPKLLLPSSAQLPDLGTPLSAHHQMQLLQQLLQQQQQQTQVAVAQVRPAASPCTFSGYPSFPCSLTPPRAPRNYLAFSMAQAAGAVLWLAGGKAACSLVPLSAGSEAVCWTCARRGTVPVPGAATRLLSNPLRVRRGASVSLIY